MSEVRTYRQRIPTIQAMHIDSPEDMVECLHWLTKSKASVRARMEHNYDMFGSKVRLFLTLKVPSNVTNGFGEVASDTEVVREIINGDWVMVDVMTEEVSVFYEPRASKFALDWQEIETPATLEE